MRRSPRGGMLRLALMAAALVAAALLAAVLAGGHARASSPPSSKPLHSDWQLSPEFPASDPVYVDAATSQSRPKMAFDGTNYLVVWQEDRDYQYGDVYAARVTPDGTVLDPYGIPIAAAGAWQGNPAVAFDGTNYLVTWSERGYPDGDVYAARVSPAGTVLDPNGFPVAAGPGLQDYSAVAFDGTNYLVTWMDEDPNTLEADVYAARVTPSGAVLDPDGFAVSLGAGLQWEPTIAFDGTNYLVAWTQGSGGPFDIYGARVTPAGTVLDPLGIAISTASDGQESPAIVFDGANYLVAWTDRRSGLSDVYGTRIQPDGTVLEPSGIPISTAQDSQFSPTIAFGGTTFMVVWSDARPGGGEYGARVSSAGVVLDPNGIPISTSGGGGPAIGFDGTRYLVAWSRLRSVYTNQSDLFAARVETSGQVLDPSGLPIDRLAPSEQTAPSVAFDGANYFAVWQDSRAGNPDIYGGRVTSQGALLDGTGIPLAVGTDDQIHPAVTFDGANYLVAWEIRHSDRQKDVVGARVSPSGTVLGPSGFPISAGNGAQSSPAVASDGSRSLVVWEDSRYFPKPPSPDFLHGPPPPPPPPPPPRYDLFGARVDRDGTVLDPNGIGVSTETGDQVDPALAFDGANYLVAWTDGRSNLTDVFGARVSPAGSVLDSGGIGIATGASFEWQPAVAAGGGSSLVVWQDDRTLGYWDDIFAARVGPDGTVLDADPFPVTDATGVQGSPVLAFDGVNYFAAWRDGRRDGIPDLYGARIDASGSVLDPAGILLSGAGTQEGGLAETGGSFGQAATAYSRIGSEPPYGGAQRVFLRVFSEEVAPPPPPPVPPPPPPSGPPPPPPPPPTRCRVPHAVGLRLAIAKRRIHRAHCSVGRIQRIHTRRRLRGRVVRQSPRPRSIRRRGYPVRLVVGRL